MGSLCSVKSDEAELGIAAEDTPVPQDAASGTGSPQVHASQAKQEDALSLDNMQLVTGHGEQPCVRLSIQSGSKLVTSLETYYPSDKHRTPWLLSGDDQGTIKLWNFEHTQSGPLAIFTCCKGDAPAGSQAVKAMIGLSDGKVAAATPSSINIWHLALGKALRLPLPHHPQNPKEASDIVAFVDGSLAASYGSSIFFWSAVQLTNAYDEAGMENHDEPNFDRDDSVTQSVADSVRRVEYEAELSALEPMELKADSKAECVCLIRIDVTSEQCVGGFSDGSIRLFQPSVAQTLRDFPHEHSSAVTGMCILPDGKKNFVSVSKGQMRFWSVLPGPRVVLAGKIDHPIIGGAVITPDVNIDRVLITHNHKGQVAVWGIHDKELFAASFAGATEQPDGKPPCLVSVGDGVVSSDNSEDITLWYVRY